MGELLPRGAQAKYEASCREHKDKVMTCNLILTEMTNIERCDFGIKIVLCNIKSVLI